ncbi:hypothetical protein OE88DRAFT_1642739 [Heliocybe sulcata]|uniref:Uncharacterized protein n=1 Tax=Heliocybe sulcata TaxID=5364 RepID=A0A5C3NDN5_9AGAM|nr:hypothetical protein OE88DRAFT_1642739 [Heliocybe sulcata]
MVSLVPCILGIVEGAQFCRPWIPTTSDCPRLNKPEPKYRKSESADALTRNADRCASNCSETFHLTSNEWLIVALVWPAHPCSVLDDKVLLRNGLPPRHRRPARSTVLSDQSTCYEYPLRLDDGGAPLGGVAGLFAYLMNYFSLIWNSPNDLCNVIVKAGSPNLIVRIYDLVSTPNIRALSSGLYDGNQADKRDPDLRCASVLPVSGVISPKDLISDEDDGRRLGCFLLPATGPAFRDKCREESLLSDLRPP